MTRRRTPDEVSEHDDSFGARLRRLRKDAGLTQQELAERAGLSLNAVNGLERGVRKHLYPHTVRSLAEALGLSEEERSSLLAAVPRRDATASGIPSLSPRATLPSPPTPLVGREQELEEIRERLLDDSEVRLLTLTGIGGVGKTRLALEVVRALLAESYFPDGIAFVALAPLRDPALVVSTVARSLGLKEEQGQSPRDAIHTYLREKRLLLVLDNFEHLLEAAAEVVDLIESCPDLRMLTTSRAPLRVRGEHEYPVPPLVLPSSTQNPTEEKVLGTPSGRLFVERARAASPSFVLTTENAPSVAAICWRLAGLPLALELAAAKVRLLEPAALLSRLDQALSMAWARDLPKRQRTMRAALDWSYELLSESERRLFCRLSVFAGGSTLEAIETVGATEDSEEVLGLLGALVEQSLVMVQQPKAGSELRYAMLEPVRQYALNRLEESGDAGEAHRKHAEYFVELAERAEPELQGAHEVEWLERLERDNDNLRVAFSWFLGATGEAQIAARLGWALRDFIWVRGYHREGRRWAEATLEHELPDDLRARALHLAAMTAYIQGDYTTAAEQWEEVMRLSRRVGDMLVEAHAVACTGLVAMANQDHEAASSRLEEAIALFERCEEDHVAQNLSSLRAFLGTTMLARGEAEQAERAFEEALALARRLGHPAIIQIPLYYLAQSALTRGDLREAASMLLEGIELSGQTKDKASLAHLLEAFATVRALSGEAERSAVLLGAAEGLLEEVGARVYNQYVPDPSLQERAVVQARDVLGEADFEEARERGREMNFEQAVEYALEDNEFSPT
jgi:predicted ATPase/DNA-binding XRE family transcriptional regulator